MEVDEPVRHRGVPTIRKDSKWEGNPMPTESTTSADFVLTLNEGERDVLLALLKHELGEVRVEVHHTDNREYRESVVQRAEVIRGLMEKLQEPQPV